MKKLILLFLFIPLGLFSQPKYDSIRISSLDPNGVSVAAYEQPESLRLYQNVWYYRSILKESYPTGWMPNRKNFRQTSEYIGSDIIEKSFDINGTLKEELFHGKQNYLRLFNQWGKLKVKI